MRWSSAILTMVVISSAHAAEQNQLERFSCGQPNCGELKCAGPGITIDEKFQTIDVYQYKDHPRRLWLSVDGRHMVLGDDVTCRFGAQPVVALNPVVAPNPKINVVRPVPANPGFGGVLGNSPDGNALKGPVHPVPPGACIGINCK